MNSGMSIVVRVMNGNREHTILSIEFYKYYKNTTHEET